MFTVQVFMRKFVTEPFDCVGAYKYERKTDALEAAKLAVSVTEFRAPYLWSVEVLDAEGRKVYRKGFNVWGC